MPDQELAKQPSAVPTPFEPGVNEDLAATRSGHNSSITIVPMPPATVCSALDAGHGVDRTGDVFRQANIQGTAQHGGVWLWPATIIRQKWSMFAHETDQIFEAALCRCYFHPRLKSIMARSGWHCVVRFCGLWVGFKTITDTVESGATICVQSCRLSREIDRPPHGCNYDVELKWPSQRQLYESHDRRTGASGHAFVYANRSTAR